MGIRMAGIDHSKATIEQREVFAFTKAGTREALEYVKNIEGIEGCLLLSTCNRTELWISGEDTEPLAILCHLKNLAEKESRQYFTVREGNEAINHLLNLVCGFDSKIFGEDQIISQVREALLGARDAKCADLVIEKIFQKALATGKKVKTKGKINNINPSSAQAMMEIISTKLATLEGEKCLVIGNGQMGRLAAQKLEEAGAKVSMTLRKHIHGDNHHKLQSEQKVFFRDSWEAIPYEKRLEAIRDKKIIVSATLSPHYTLKLDEIRNYLENDKYYIFDLAVPRDVDVKIGKLENVELFDIDSLGKNQLSLENQESLKAAMEILNIARDDIEGWFQFREQVPIVKGILEMVSNDARLRMGKEIFEEAEDMEFTENMEQAVKKATGKLIYGLKETLPREMWNKCLQGLHQAAAKDTLKH